MDFLWILAAPAVLLLLIIGCAYMRSMADDLCAEADYLVGLESEKIERQ